MLEYISLHKQSLLKGKRNTSLVILDFLWKVFGRRVGELGNLALTIGLFSFCSVEALRGTALVALEAILNWKLHGGHFPLKDFQEI